MTVYDFLKDHSIFFSSSDAPEYRDVELVIDEGMDTYSNAARRPYFRLRGRSVTKEQAREIIRRTDVMSPWSMELKCEDIVFLENFCNYWTRSNFFPSPFGWAHPDGTIGINSITDKNPFFEELLEDCAEIAYSFPHLDLVIAITSWNELPQYIWDDLDSLSKYTYEDYEGFLDNIVIGFWIHNGMVEVMSPERTVKMYSEYDEKYSDKDFRKYCPEYYMDLHPDVITDEFVAECYKAYGADGIPENSEWLKKKKRKSM